MATKREQIIELAHRIAAIREQQGLLPRLEAELDTLLGGANGAQRRSGAETATEATGTVVTPILGFLAENPGRSFDAKVIAGKIGADNLSSVRSALIRLQSQGRIQRKRRGEYAAKPHAGEKAG